MQFFKSLIQLFDTFHNEEDCRLFLEREIWGESPVCPKCGLIDDKHYKLKFGGNFTGMYKCRSCKQRFNIRTGTMFEGTHVPLRHWFYAIYVFLGHKKGISSIQLHKDIDVTQKTAWYMLHKIRQNLEAKCHIEFEEVTQIDETYVGGKVRGPKWLKDKKWKEAKKDKGRSTLHKTVVMGLLSKGKVQTVVIPDASGETLKTVIYNLIPLHTIIVTDGWKGYNGINEFYDHKVIKHNKGIYVDKKGYHTNSIEGFWSQLKRGIVGVYHAVSRKHLYKYCSEFAYRYNTREMTDGERFISFIKSNSKVTYNHVLENKILRIQFSE